MISSKTELIPVEASLDRILRVVITSSCNRSCFYCHKEGMTSQTVDILTTSDISFFIQATAGLFDGLAIVGGEPLLETSLLKIAEVGTLTTGRPVHLTTNASIPMNDVFSNPGLFERINISLNTLSPSLHKQLCKTSFSNVIYENAEKLSRLPCGVHVNSVTISGVNTNEDEILSLSDFCIQFGFHLEFLHFMPRSNKEIHLLTKGLGQFRSVMNKLGFKSSYRYRPYSHPNTKYLLGDRKIVLRDYGQAVDPLRCSDCLAQPFCTEGLSHIRLLPNGVLIACRYGTRFKLNLLSCIKKRLAASICEQVKSLQFSIKTPLFWYQLPNSKESE